MKPFFFGESSQPLFGFHHDAAAGRARGWGVVICNPFGQEALRSHRALRELGRRLAAAGFDVLRFDYRGTGDSWGGSGEGRVEHWVEDVVAAVEEAREVGGKQRVALIGLRLGAALALLATARSGAERVVLWEPVLEGGAYLAELERTHQEWSRDHLPEGAPADTAGSEVLGFPMPEALRGSIGAIDLRSAVLGDGVRALVLAAEPGAGSTLQGEVERRPVARVAVWEHADDGMARSIVPGALLEELEKWLVASCP